MAKGLSRARATALRATLAALAALALAPGFVAAATTDCAAEANVDFASTSWGGDARQTRTQANSDIRVDNVAQLRLDWVYALPGGNSPHSYPLVTADTLFIGTQSGVLLALDRASGCKRFRFQADSEVRTALTAGRVGDQALIFFGTRGGFVYALEARTGRLAWSRDVRDHDAGMVTGTPVLHAGKLYVPLSSSEVVLATSGFYGCCTFRGSVSAWDAATGEFIWRSHTIDREPKLTHRHWVFVRNYGPSGAPVWSAPTIDARRNQILFGTGENYSGPSSGGSDAIFALDLDTGERRWRTQYTADDNFNVACNVSADHPNCPAENGPDLDFGAPPILGRLQDGSEVVLAGQKSGYVHALTPDNGTRLWSRRLGRGGYLGGIHWGMAFNEELGLLYAPISDIRQAPPGVEGEPSPGLSAIDAATGEVRWQQPVSANCDGRSRCLAGFSAAPGSNAELVFVGGLDGMLLAFDAASGAERWRFDTWAEFASVNGGDGESRANGGAIDVHGPQLVEDLLIVQSGYAGFGQRGGNALMVFRLTDDAS
ncbi:MAG: PQQ-binding-like beta-propeller repeat protein [Pseudomonadota bacterium]